MPFDGSMHRDDKLQPVIDYLFYALIFVTPILRDTSCYDHYTPAKIAWAKTLILGLALAYAIRVLWGGELTITLRWLNLFIVVFFLYNMLTVLWAQSASMALDHTSWSLYLLLFVICWQDWVAGDRRRLFKALWLLLAAAAITAVWTLLQDFNAPRIPPNYLAENRLGDWRGYLSAGFGNTGHIADFLALCILPAVATYFFTRGKGREIFLLIVVWLAAAAMIVCWSVHSNLGLIVAGWVLSVILLRWNVKRLLRRRKLRIGVLLIGWLGIVLFYVLPAPHNPHSFPDYPGIFQQAFGSGRWQKGGDTRIAIWLNSWESAKAYPVLGAGGGNFIYVQPQRYSPKLLEKEEWLHYAGMYTNSAHNELLETWVETGLIGLGLLLLVLGGAFVALIRKMAQLRQNRVARRVYAVTACMLLAFFIDAQMSFPLRLPFTQLLFWALISIPACFPESLFGRFALRVSAPGLGPIDLQALTTGMSRIESISVRGRVWPAARWLTIAILGLCCAWLTWQSWQSLRSQRELKMAYEANRRATAARFSAIHGAYLEEVIQHCRRALEHNPDNQDARSILCGALIQLRRPEDLFEHLQILEQRFQASELFLYYSRYYHLMGSWAKEREYFDIFSKREPVKAANYSLMPRIMYQESERQ